MPPQAFSAILCPSAYVLKHEMRTRVVSLVTSPVCLQLGEPFTGSGSEDMMDVEGSAVTWEIGPATLFQKSLMDLLEDGSVVTILKSLMRSLEDGSVVTWRSVPKSLMDLLEDGSVVEVPPCNKGDCASVLLGSVTFLSCEGPPTTLSWFSGAGNDPETVQERHPDYPWLHSRVPR